MVEALRPRLLILLPPGTKRRQVQPLKGRVGQTPLLLILEGLDVPVHLPFRRPFIPPQSLLHGRHLEYGLGTLAVVPPPAGSGLLRGQAKLPA